MSNHPEIPEQCPICNRVEDRIRNSGLITDKLSENEVDELVETVQASILNKKVSKRGIEMENEENDKYLITKASFEDFYQTQSIITGVLKKMAEEIQNQNMVLKKYGSAIAEIASRLPDDEYEEDEEVDEVDVNAPEDEELEDEVPEDEAVPDEEMAMGEDDMKKAFEAGYKAALADKSKEAGVPVAKATAKATRVPVSTDEINKATDLNGGSIGSDVTSLDSLGKMSPHQLNLLLRDSGKIRGGK